MIDQCELIERVMNEFRYDRDKFEHKMPEFIVYCMAKCLSPDIKLLPIDRWKVPLLSDEPDDNNEDDNKEKDEETEKQFKENIRAVFDKYEIDTDLVVYGLPMLSRVERLTPDQEAVYREFQDFLFARVDNILPDELLTKAVNDCVIPVADVFRRGATKESINSYQIELADSFLKGEFFSAFQDSNPDMIERTDLFDVIPKYEKLQSRLLEVVKGQDTAVEKFVAGCFRGEFCNPQETRKAPEAYFFLFGPPGTGKTLLSETYAELSGRKYLRLNMSEYADRQNVTDLIGSAPTFKNSQEGQLTRFLKENPEAVILFDEIEKADSAVTKLFLQILSAGVLRDAHLERDIDCTKTVMVFTSNVGINLYSDRNKKISNLPEKTIVSAVASSNKDGKKVFPPELVSRIAAGNCIVFDHIGISTLIELAEDSFKRLADNLQKEYDCTLEWDDIIPLFFLYSRGNDIDARVAASQSLSMIKNEVYELFRQLSGNKRESITSIHVSVDMTDCKDEIRALFDTSTTEKPRITFLGEGSDENKLFDPDSFEIYRPGDEYENEYKEIKKSEVIVIDPLYGLSDPDESISVSDYKTRGIALLDKLKESQLSIPTVVYVKKCDLTRTDIRSFLNGGADYVFGMNKDLEYISSQVKKIAYDHIRQKKNVDFCAQGNVIDYKTRQVVDEGGKASIVFYGLRKKKAMDVAERNLFLQDSDIPSITFEDIIGADEAKEKLIQFYHYLKNREEYEEKGYEVPKGILMHGPSGTGKTSLAKALAGECKIQFISCTGNDFISKYAGEGKDNLKRAFSLARKVAPSILFIDEIDAIGRVRTGSDNTHSTEGVLNQLLTEMDGFKDYDKPVLVLAATNYGVKDDDSGATIDQALLRRFTNRVYVGYPSVEDKIRFIKKQIMKYRNNEVTDDTIESVANQTHGCSLSIIKDVCAEAGNTALFANRPVNNSDLEEAAKSILFGKKKEIDPDHKKRTAYHEAGHAIISWLAGQMPVIITAEARGDFGGYVQRDVQQYSLGREEVLWNIRISLAGRASEELFFEKESAINTGAESDLKNATFWAWRMLGQFGMIEGQLVSLSMSEMLVSQMAGDFLNKCNDILMEQYKITSQLLSENKSLIEKVAKELVEHNYITRQGFRELVEEKP